MDEWGMRLMSDEAIVHINFFIEHFNAKIIHNNDHRISHEFVRHEAGPDAPYSSNMRCFPVLLLS